MTNELYFPFDDVGGDRLYSSADWASFYGTLFTNGVISTIGSALQVNQAAALGMNISLSDGCAMLNGRLYQHTAADVFSVPIASTIQDRVDSVVIQLDLSNRLIQAVYKQNDTTVTRTDLIYELQVATISVGKNVTQILQANITDTRSNSAVCGFSTPYEKVDPSGLLSQYLSQAGKDQAQMTASFESWFETIKDQLGTDAAGNLQNQINTITQASTLASAGLLDLIYPIGSYYTSSVSTNPATLFGGGTWQTIMGRVIISVDPNDTDFNASNLTGGEKKHILTIDEMPSHTHTQNSHTHTGQFQRSDKTVSNYGLASAGGFANMPLVQQGSSSFINSATATNNNTGGGQAHNNLPPYITAYVWKRTA